MKLNEIRDEVLNTGVEKILNRNASARNSKSKWKSKSFIVELLKQGNLEEVDFQTILTELHSRIAEHLRYADFLSSSKIRGKKRPGFTPIGKKALEEALLGRKLEVPLERALALVNSWFCQFSSLSGCENSCTYKRKSIDLVWTPSDCSRQGYLIELKEWDSKDHILFAAVEIVMYWICFICVRRIDNETNNPQASEWPKWSDFKLRVMAPETYFKNQPEDYGILVETMSKALNDITISWILSREEYGVNSCDLAIVPLSIKEESFMEFVKKNHDVLISVNACKDNLIRENRFLDVDLH